jgi:hypothetical protein
MSSMSGLALALLLTAAPHPWGPAPEAERLSDRIEPPAGFVRRPAPDGSFAAWLRALPVRPGRPAVRLHDGREKRNQTAQHVVLDVDVGKRDLQQCADAVMRLRAEYLWASGKRDAICFRYTSGDALWWSRWAAGERPRIRGSKVSFARIAKASASYRSFRDYLDSVFMYAGTASLERELRPVADPRRIEAGDVFIRGGFPGHAVLVVDVAERADGARRFLLAQSYMPAQDIHVLVNPGDDGPWYEAARTGPLVTPEWRFDQADLRRFADEGCPR